MSKPGGDSVVTFVGFPVGAPTSSTFEKQDLEGRVVSERDQYGNEWYYEWSSLGEGDFRERDIVRLRAIYLNGTPGNELARVEFHWHGDTTANSPYSSTSSTDARFGRLAEVEVVREDDLSQDVVTQSVRYIYYDDVASDTIGGETITLGDVYDASSGDLIEVVISKVMSDSSDYHQKVFQYRYYSSANNDNGNHYNDNGFGVLVELSGQDHQLMSVVYPEQMEFYADYLIQEAERQNTTSGTLLGDDTSGLYSTYYSNGFNTVADAAELLRWVRFDNTTDDHSHDDAAAFLLANTRWQSLYDIAGKILSYYPDSSTGNTDGRVRTQIVSSGDGSASCGCGGSTAGMNLGKRFDYLYRRYTLPTDIAEAPSGYDYSNGYSCQIVESYLGFDSGLVFTPYRVHCHDYFWPSSLDDGEIADSNGVARRGAGLTKIATATVPADPSWNFDPDDYSSNPIFATTGNRWATAYEYDLDTEPSSGTFTSYRKLLRKLTPAALGSSYEPAGVSSITDAPDWDHAPTSGLVYEYNYDSGSGWMDWYGVRDGVSGTPVKLAEYDRDGTTRPDLPNEVVRRPGTGPTGDTPVERTTITRGYYGGTGGAPPTGEEADAVVAWERMKADAETEAQNGPSGTVDYSTWRIWDQQGQLRWERDAGGTLTCYAAYDERTGVATHIVHDADPSNSAYVTSAIALNSTNFPGLTSGNGWSVPSRSDYEELEEQFQVDLLGRVVSHEDPGGVMRYWQYETRTVKTVDDSGALVDRGVPYATILEFPHGFVDSSIFYFDGPITISASNAAGKNIITALYIAGDSSGTYDPIDGDYVLGSLVAKSEMELQLSGVVIKSRDWHNVGASAADGSYVTEYTYDALGRLKATIDPEGGIQVNGYISGSGEETGYDLLDRIIQTSEGLDSSHSTIQRTARYFYDSPHAFSQPGNAAQGVGNGNLNYMEMYTGETTGGTRSTYRWFDFRDRLIGEAPPELPYRTFTYDDLDRRVEEASFASASGFGSSVPAPSTNSTDRSVFVQRIYNNRAAVYRTRLAIDPGTGSSPTYYLESLRWFDEDGNVVASWRPNSPAIKTEYDSLDRPTVIYQTDRYSDALNGLAGNYSDATSISDDHVIDQTEYAYVQPGDPGAGEVGLVASRMRLHDAPEDGTGDAVGALTDSTSITTYTAYVRDDASRVTDVLQYGTNDSVGFVSSSSAPSSPYNTDRGTSAALVASIGFDEWGRTNLHTDPEGKKTLTHFDGMSRTIATIETQTNITEDDIDWDDTAQNWEVDWGTPPPDETDQDRVTTFAYDGLSNLVKRTAHLNDESMQVTQYVYGTSVGSVSTATDSLTASSSLLYKVHYPNESTGAADTSADYTVEYGYNQLGEQRGRKDQNGTVHKLTRDNLGRIKSDFVQTYGANIDNAVKEITISYDGHGRLEEVISLDDLSVELNSVAFEYTSLHQILAVVQDHDGDPLNDEQIQYDYTNLQPTGNASDSYGNYSRVTGIRYPSQASGSTDTIGLDYTGESDFDVINDRISRIAGYSAPSWNHTGDRSVLRYEYIGLSGTALVDYPEIEKGLDYTKAFDGSSTSGEYPGFDRYGRVVWHAWVDDDYTTGQTVGGVDYPSATPLLARRYAYDKNSNRLYDWDGRPGATPDDRDWEYVYDNLHRLKTANRGVRDEFANPSGLDSGSTPEDSEQWTLDMLGNWKGFITDTDGDGLFESGAETELRTFNAANEILTREGEPGSGPGGSTPVYDYAYDKAGNFRDNDGGNTLGLQYTHDAWNRLVRVERTDSMNGDFIIQENTYNGLNWRVTHKVDLAKGAYDGLDETRTYYYSAGWQMIEEHVDSDDDGTDDYKSQQIWGARYIDDAVAKRIDRNNDNTWTDSESEYYYLTDATYSVRALVNSSQRVQERIDYTPYGVATHRYAADFNEDGALNSFDNGTLTTNTANGGLSPGDTGYDPDVDSNGDGSNDFYDVSAYLAIYNAKNSNSIPDGWISDPTDSSWTDNSVGYNGYFFDYAGAVDASSTGIYSVRNRVYDPKLGNWLQRDPLVYIDSSNLFQYGQANPSRYADPSGRAVEVLEPAHRRNKNSAWNLRRPDMPDLYWDTSDDIRRTKIWVDFVIDIAPDLNISIPIANPINRTITCCKNGALTKCTYTGTEIVLGFKAGVSASWEKSWEKDVEVDDDCPEEGDYYELAFGVEGEVDAVVGRGKLKAKPAFRYGPGGFDTLMDIEFDAGALGLKGGVGWSSGEKNKMKTFLKAAWSLGLKAGADVGSFAWYTVKCKDQDECCGD